MSKTIHQRVIEWFASGDNGSSSESIVFHMTGCERGACFSYPSDPSDLGRCLRLLARLPEWELRMAEMAQYGPGWAGIVSRWNEIKQSMIDEVGIDWSKGKSAPKTYNLMKLAIADGYRNDERYNCTFSEDGCLSSAWRK